ncbi:ribosomal protein L22/L17 [Artemisia annua]|uniref:Ribosomal protein L22/L17 n=1 Tax=Artemisia annua TaxID=35608 RepID=A0A2U1NRX3_ARTAN|nr:ribosomal protein L22/L17 [Artemisia annua]
MAQFARRISNAITKALNQFSKLEGRPQSCKSPMNAICPPYQQRHHQGLKPIMRCFEWNCKRTRKGLLEFNTEINYVVDENTRETAHALHKMPLIKAKRYLEDVLAHKQAIPFTRFRRGVGRTAQPKNRHSNGQGRCSTKSAKFILDLLKNVESNAEVKGLDVDALHISRIQRNEEEIQAKISVMEGSRKRHQDETSSGRSQYAEQPTSLQWKLSRRI